MKKSTLYIAILKCIHLNKLTEPFRVSDVNNCCKRLLEKSPSFLSKHRLGNPGGNNVYFKRVTNNQGQDVKGLYEIYKPK